ncbi:MAG: tetratricopeptide repeat protein, partial [Microcoleus sp. SU_5_3]|nr:tetratricopeptide repeat protein [Microcoleus sp. SU_5_3]
MEASEAEGDRLLQQGLQQNRTSQLRAALNSFQQALQIYRALKNRQGEAAALGNLGVTYFNQGNRTKAIEYLKQSLAIAREIKYRPGEAFTLGNLGYTYVSVG